MAMPYWIADERRVHDLLESNGIPVPHVYGYCDDPYVMLMDRLPRQRGPHLRGFRR